MKKVIATILCYVTIATARPLDEALIRAIKMEHIGDLKILLEQGAYINYQDREGNTPLIYAAWEGNPAILDILINNGAIIDLANNKKQTPLMIATMGKKRCAIKSLLYYGANPNLQDCNGNTAPMLATFIEHPKVSASILSFFLQPSYHIDLTIQNNDGDNLLTLAVFSERYYLVEDIVAYINTYALEQKQIIFNQKNNDGESALTLSCELFENRITMLLINHGANIEITNSYGNTPLMIAVLKHNMVLINYLIKHCANLNHQNNHGYTALMFATVNGKDKIVSTLLKHNADKTVKNNHDETAYDLALSHKYKEIGLIIRNCS